MSKLNITEAYHSLLCNYTDINCALSPYRGPPRSIRDAPPIHYTFKIQSFSMLSKHSRVKCESSIFEAGGYRWKVSLYPKGNKNEKGENHLSLYLVMADTNSLPLGWDVVVMFRLFLFDQIRGKYLVLEETCGRLFNDIKKEWGFVRFIHLRTFNKPSNGYLIDDACVFGAEVFVIQERRTGKGECLSIANEVKISRFSWKIEKVSELNNKKPEQSKTFRAGEYKWKIKLYMYGNGEAGDSSSLSFYLSLADSTTLPPGFKVYVEYYLRVIDQLRGKNYSRRGNDWFSVFRPKWGWQQFMALSKFNDPEIGFVVEDTCIVEAEVTVLGLVNILS